MTATAFLEILEEGERRFPTKHAFAKAIGVTPTRYSHMRRGYYAPNVKNCLRLATAAGLPASRVLRAAGKGDIAELIEEHYGANVAPQSAPLPQRERQLLADWEVIPPSQRKALRAILTIWADGARASSPTVRRRTDKRRADKSERRTA